MASDLGEFYESPDSFKIKGSPPPKSRGCFFYGCITVSVLALLVAVGVGLASYTAYKAYLQLVEQNTSSTPVELPKVTLNEEERKTLDERVAAFKKALDTGEDAEPLVLTADELNAVLAEHGKTEGRIYFRIVDDKLKGEVSLPLEELHLPGLKGRYFNGTATFRVSLEEGRLVVFTDAAEINGKPISEHVMSQVRNKNLAEDSMRDPENSQFLNKLESIHIKDGKITIKAKPKADRSPKSSEKTTKKEEPSSEALPTQAKAEDKPAKAEDKPAEVEKSPAQTPAPEKEQPKEAPPAGDASKVEVKP